MISVGHSQDVSGRIEVMKKELNRNFEILQKEAVPPYYMSYSIDSVRTLNVLLPHENLWVHSGSGNSPSVW